MMKSDNPEFIRKNDATMRDLSDNIAGRKALVAKEKQKDVEHWKKVHLYESLFGPVPPAIIHGQKAWPDEVLSQLK